jgi:histidine triad (HIT) family protein
MGAVTQPSLFDAPPMVADQHGCPFCDIAHGRGPHELVCDWGHTMAIVPLNPVVPGHVIVIPKVHVPDATYDPNITAMTMMGAAQIARPQCNIITSAGIDATQTVFHLHVHVVPRRSGDGLKLPWTN